MPPRAYCTTFSNTFPRMWHTPLQTLLSWSRKTNTSQSKKTNGNVEGYRRWGCENVNSSTIGNITLMKQADIIMMTNRKASVRRLQDVKKMSYLNQGKANRLFPGMRTNPKDTDRLDPRQKNEHSSSHQDDVDISCKAIKRKIPALWYPTSLSHFLGIEHQ